MDEHIEQLKVVYESVLSNPSRLRKLKEEGREGIPDSELIDLSEDEAIKRAIDAYCELYQGLSEEEKVVEAWRLKFELHATEVQMNEASDKRKEISDLHKESVNLIIPSEIKEAQIKINLAQEELMSMYQSI